MPFFSSSSPFDQDVEKVTSENNTSEDWGLILEIIDKMRDSSNGPKDCLKSIIRRLNHNNPNVSMQALTLMNACIANGGKSFHLEVCTRETEAEIRRQLSGKAHPKVADKLKEFLKNWAENEFKSDHQLSLIPSLYNKLKSEGMSFNPSDPPTTRAPALSSDPNVVNSQQEQDDIAKAIELSLKDTGGASAKVTTSPPVNNQLYPSAKAPSPTPLSNPVKEARKVRAIYDFEAAEDNELTFKSGEIIHVIDDSDANWWKGSNQRGEGLFPSNFVTNDLSVEHEEAEKVVAKKTVQFNEDVQVKTVESTPVVSEISETTIDNLLHQLHEADPTGERPDSPELISLEDQCAAMSPLIDQQLENVDRKHASLTSLSRQLVDALNMYHSLMREYPAGRGENANNYANSGVQNNAGYPIAAPTGAPVLPKAQQPQQPPQPPYVYAPHPMMYNMAGGGQHMAPPHTAFHPQQQQQQPQQMAPHHQFSPDMNQQRMAATPGPVQQQPPQQPPMMSNMQHMPPMHVEHYPNVPYCGPGYTPVSGMAGYGGPPPPDPSYMPGAPMTSVGQHMPPPTSIYHQAPPSMAVISNGAMQAAGVAPPPNHQQQPLL